VTWARSRNYWVVLRRPAGLIAAIATVVIATPFAMAAGGELDGTFGHGGRVVTDLGANAEAGAIALEPDGKIVLGASSLRGDLILARYDAGGTLDVAFGRRGSVVTDLGGTDGVADVAVQRDGKIFVAGVNFDSGGSVILRYRTDGSPDPSFGNGGKVDLGNVRASAVLVRPNGKLVVVGTSGRDSFVLTRYNPIGSVDRSFGRGGKVVTAVGGAAHFPASSRAAAFAPDGKIVVAGSRMHPDKRSSADGLPYSMVVARYRADGRLDRSFGRAGVGTVDLRPHDSSIGDVAVLRDGRIVVAGHGHLRAGTAGGPAAWCFQKNGALDRRFGTRGKAVIGNDGGLATSLRLDRSGRIILVGRGGASLGDFLVARLKARGRPDPSFGGDGVVTTDFGGVDTPWAMTLAPNGDVLAAGGTGAELGAQGARMVAIARYLGR
jgi:uncharacterized delta-60 repeat protein